MTTMTSYPSCFSDLQMERCQLKTLQIEAFRGCRVRFETSNLNNLHFFSFSVFILRYTNRLKQGEADSVAARTWPDKCIGGNRYRSAALCSLLHRLWLQMVMLSSSGRVIARLCYFGFT